MADGCISNIVKYALFITNFLIFVLACAVLGCGIWVLVDKPAFLDLFAQAEDYLPEGQKDKLDISLYTSAAYIIIVVAALAAIISFFGCFGAIKESKCMLGTYFVLILAMFIVMVVGAVLGYTGDFEDTLKTPLKDALAAYKDGPVEDKDIAYKNIWNEVQSELKCCGVDSALDWQADATHGFGTGVKVPAGCCHYQNIGGTWTDIWKDSTNEVENGQVQTCRRNTGEVETTYYFKGCYTKIVDTIKENQNIVSGVAIGVVAVMFLNMLFSFAMCTMVD